LLIFPNTSQCTAVITAFALYLTVAHNTGAGNSNFYQDTVSLVTCEKVHAKTQIIVTLR